jgi:hypothetical protein
VCSKTLNLLRIEISKRTDIKQDPTHIRHSHMSENSELTWRELNISKSLSWRCLRFAFLTVVSVNNMFARGVTPYCLVHIYILGGTSINLQQTT